MDKKIINLRDYLNDLGIILSFTGPFSQGMIEEIGDALKIYMENKENTKNEIFNVFSVFIEQTQNIRNYVEQQEHDEEREKIINSGIIVIASQQKKYLIRSGNLVKKEDVGGLRDYLEEILSYDKEGLKTLYRKRLMSGFNDEKNNASLGIIDIVRKSTTLEYQFEEIDENYEFFTMDVLV